MNDAPRCALGKIQPVAMDTERIKREGWQQHRILVVSLNDPRLDFVLRRMIETVGDAIYDKGDKDAKRR